MYGRVAGATILGVGGRPVTVEAFVGRGLPSFTLTGLPGAPIQDARDRIRPAVEHAGLEWPLRRVVVNLAPGNLRKEGPGLDLPIAVAVLAATAQVPERALDGWIFSGELSLKGEVLPTPGILSVAIAAARSGFTGVVVPASNHLEASQVEGLEVAGVDTLAEAARFLRGTWRPSDAPAPHALLPRAAGVDLSEIRGQAQARRALEVAAAGGHNLLMVGSPGAGKTMLARRLPTILPALTREEALETSQLHSVAGLLSQEGLVRSRPFRAPHHTVSTTGLLGGGSSMLRPGRRAWRTTASCSWTSSPSSGAMPSRRCGNPSRTVASWSRARWARSSSRLDSRSWRPPTRAPAGIDGDPVRPCRCQPNRLQQYRQKLSGPLLDRIDLRMRVPRLTKHELMGSDAGEPSAAVRARVEEARERQRRRCAAAGARCNAQLPGPVIRREALLSAEAEALLARAVDAMALTGRGFDRALKVARTIADLARVDRIGSEHLAEALSYRTGFEDREEPARAAG